MLPARNCKIRGVRSCVRITSMPGGHNTHRGGEKEGATSGVENGDTANGTGAKIRLVVVDQRLVTRYRGAGVEDIVGLDDSGGYDGLAGGCGHLGEVECARERGESEEGQGY